MLKTDSQDTDGQDGGTHPLDASDLLPSRLAGIAQALSIEIEEPFRARHSLPMKDWKVMSALAVHGALPPTEIHRLGGQNRAQITRALKCLLDRELVVKHPHPDDNRTFVVALTDAGRKMYVDILGQMRARQAEVVGRLPDGEAESLRGLLGRLEEALLR
ncbi:MAG: MarR family winged helix-turn-helix transcriptional regulator [Bauldia litoralis]